MNADPELRLQAQTLRRAAAHLARSDDPIHLGLYPLMDRIACMVGSDLPNEQTAVRMGLRLAHTILTPADVSRETSNPHPQPEVET